MAAREVLVCTLLLFLSLILLSSEVSSEVLTPPYFNLAEGRRITATATCGDDVSDRELYCKLTGADIAGRYGGSGNPLPPNLIQGQLCDYCDAFNHPPEYAIDGTERWWQSPPLSRDMQFNQVNLTIDLGQEFHVAYVYLKMANSPRPGVWALERSTDLGKTWKAWQYFADTPSDCYNFFGMEAASRITADDTVVCTTEYSKVVPLEGGEVAISLVNNRPNAQNFSYATTLQEWTKATNVRMRLLRTKTLLGHLMAVARQDTTVTRRYYYSIKDISIGGRCVCNGHADVCDKTDPTDPYKLLCHCQHNTCGPQCGICCPGFVQKKWRKATESSANACEPCQCFGHSNDCVYDDQVDRLHQSIDIHGNMIGGGVCQSCRDNTEGINCERCKPGFYRPYGVSLNATNACQPCRCDPVFSTGECETGSGRCKCKAQFQGANCEECANGYYDWPACKPCDCNYNGTEGGVCEVGGGQCPCKVNYEGLNCDRCAYGYFNFPQCTSCQCNSQGALSVRCNEADGQCTCRNNYGGRTCDQCNNGYYRFPTCAFCNCDPSGTEPEVCDKDYGRCQCKPQFAGSRCDRCAPGFYRYPDCIPCTCNAQGSQNDACDNSGQCLCKPSFAGRSCGQCAPGYYRYPECLACNCDTYGALGTACDQQTGQCLCRLNFHTLTCNKCKEGYYNYPVCEECNCNPAGAKEVPGFPLGGCGAFNDGRLCECKALVEGHNCDMCKPGYWNLNINNLEGCEDCNCYAAGTIGSSLSCAGGDGKCMCKPFTDGRRCDVCRDGTYDLQEHNLFGCSACNCDVGGSVDNTCDKTTGACRCRPRVNGNKCSDPLKNHYFPTLYQQKYEFEDGHTASGGKVRFGFDEGEFPSYSWRGYAILSRVQEEVIIDVDINKPSLYRLVIRYVNRNPGAVTADITVTPETSTDVQQTSNVVFLPTPQPEFVTVSGSGRVSTFVLNPGKWSISVKTPENIYLDYLVLLPQAYYEATILQKRVDNPCLLLGEHQPCKLFQYPDINVYVIAPAENGYTIVDGRRQDAIQYTDQEILTKLSIDRLTVLNSRQPSINIDVRVRPGRYVFVIRYHNTRTTPADVNQDLSVEVLTGGTSNKGKIQLNQCPYKFLCHQLVTDVMGMPGIYDIRSGQATVKITGRNDIDIAVSSIVAIPYDQWQLGIITPKFKCVLGPDGTCLSSTYISPTGSIKVEVESGENSGRIVTEFPPSITDITIGLIKLDVRAPTARINMRVSRPNLGPHIFVVHYFQPFHIGFDVNVIIEIGGQQYTGKFRPDFCPSASGCRVVIEIDDSDNGKSIDITDTDFTVYFNNTSGKQLWLDYVLAIPEPYFTTRVLEVQPIDRTGVFIAACGKEGFNVPTNITGFCRSSTFSLTTEHNNGASECGCNIDGSLSFSCSEFGGQCQCRPNVIGRTCSQCRTGYYGFPRCRPCNCPSGLCDHQSGQCICPPRVTGADCNICLPKTFGFAPLIGCEDCRCDAYGVVGGDLDCDDTSGQCSCKPNVGGRRCDKCLAGYYGFPRCSQCSCDTRGTTADICDQRTAACLCKGNSEGPQCAQCKPGNFYLEDRNPKGCTSCFCFGATTSCTSSSWRRDQVLSMDSWSVNNLDRPQIEEGSNTISVEVRNNRVNKDEAIYWVAPGGYLYNKVTSYGGKLIYTILFQLPRGDSVSAGVIQPDVVLKGNNMTLAYHSLNQPAPGVPLTVEVDMMEYKFEHAESGAPVSREQFMMVLARLEALHIRASYYTVISQSSLSDVQMDIADSRGAGSRARNVEQCQCPPSYKGTSCEQCASGYFRSRTGPYLGVCIPCQCNGHANTCDPESGHCQNCRDNTAGANCERCKAGYYRDERTGECRICSCPEPYEGQNFAETCDVRAGILIRCHCLPGYVGDRCDQCAPGHFGDLARAGGRCQACGCSGNIDPTDPSGCDSIRGDCLRCLNNTGGPACNRCKDWYYGSAVGPNRGCQQCSCDTCGSQKCDDRSGICQCKPNVVGPDCDRCAPDMYGFDDCNGCKACECGEAVNSTQCDRSTGQCHCQPGVGGRRCNQCQRGYYNYGPYGCQKCFCESDGAATCDPVTGQCMCLPGVTGERCDSCLDRWVLIPDQGCQECDNCIHLLLDDVDTIDVNITRISKELEHLSVGVAAIRRLSMIRDNVTDLRHGRTGDPRVDSLIKDPKDLDLGPLKREVKRVQEQADRLSGNAGRSRTEAEALVTDAAATKAQSEDVTDDVNEATGIARAAVRFAEEVLRQILEGIKVRNIDELVRNAEAILEEIRNRDFSSQGQNTEVELQDAIDTLNRVKSLHDRASKQFNATIDLHDKLDDISDKLRDLQNNSRASMSETTRTSNENYDNRRKIDQIKDLISRITDTRDDVRMMLDMAGDLLRDGQVFVDNATANYRAIERESSRLDVAMRRLNAAVERLSEENRGLRPLVDNATLHAEKLRRKAAELDNLFADTRGSAANALKAAKAYGDIVDAINAAMNASMSAIDAAMEALDLSSGLGERARVSKARSQALLEDAQRHKGKVTGELRNRLDNAITATDKVADVNKQTEDGLADLLIGMDMLPEGGYGDAAQAAAAKAMEAQTKATNAQRKIQNILDRLPGDLERAKQIPEDVAMANRDISRAQTQVDQVLKFVPDATGLLDRLSGQADIVKQQGRGLKLNITTLRESIIIARQEANKISLGVQFYRNTTLQVRDPAALRQSGSYTRISLFFKTSQPEGFLMYLGPDLSQGRSATDDFMAVEIVGGQAVFKYDLGAGPARITNPVNVADGEWHELIIERIGNTGKITVRTDGEEDQMVQGVSPGSNSVLDLHPTNVKYFIGGVPDRVTVPVEIQNRQLVGCIEDVSFDDAPVGLWNFILSGNSYRGCHRDVLLSVPETQFMFDGSGYIILERDRFRPSKRSTIIMNFKSYAENGLLFMAGKGNDFMSIELRNGTIVYQYNLGSGKGKLQTEKKYNDGKWHQIDAIRAAQQGLLKVDGLSVAVGKSPGDMKELSISDDIYIGGFRGAHGIAGVTNTGFAGCIRDLQLDKRTRDLNENKFAKGILPGCSNVARVVSFSSSSSLSHSYYMMAAGNAVEIGRDFQLTMTVKTEEKDGLLMVAMNNDQSQAFSLSLVDGKIVLISNPGGQRTELSTTVDTYNDGTWHYITVTKKGLDLSLFVDDKERVEAKSKGRKKKVMTTTLYFGGVPASVTLDPEIVGTTKRFIGCIGDVTINRGFVNFADGPPANRLGVSLLGCPIADPEIPTLAPPSLPPFTLPTLPPQVTPAPKCALPLRPASNGDTGAVSGTRFGSTPTSRQEFKSVPGRFRVRSTFAVDFKTSSPTGLIFYVADDRQVDSIALYLLNGQVVYSFNCGSGPASITSPNNYDDGRWHRVEFSREQQTGRLVIDGEEVATGLSQGTTKSINISPPFYVGGMPTEAAEAASGNLREASVGFMGCLRNFTLNGKPFNQPVEDVDTQPCSDNVESGTFIAADGGYVQLFDEYKVGLDLDIEFEVRPRTLSGVILSVSGVRAKGDFMAIQMVNGQMIFSVDNGAGEFNATYNPPARNELCDGQWHSIKAVKAKNVLTLNVDGVFSYPGVGEAGVSSTDTNDELYIGGVPDPTQTRGIRTSETFVGCIRNLKLDKEIQNMASGTIFGSVNTESCPTT